MSEAFEIAGEAVAPGTRVQLELPLGRLPSGDRVRIPLEVLRGRRPGPTVWLSGAIHGDEIVGVEITRRILAELRPGRLAGTVIAAPVVNVFGFVGESRYLPDRRDLNRAFPGDGKGSMAARLAHLFMTEVVALCDLGIDLHAGSDDRVNLPQVRGNLDDPETLRLARAFAAPVAIHNKPQKGTLRHAALHRDKRVVLFEGGEPRRFSRDAVEEGTAGCLRVLKAVEMIASAPDPVRETLLSRRTGWVRAARSGIFHPEVDVGARVKRRQVVGVLRDAYGRDELPVRANRSGVVVGQTVNPLVHQGDAVVHLAEVEG